MPDTKRPSLARLALEATVIIGSILLAFALDAWWDERQEVERVSELLEAVAAEFDAEIAGLDSIIAVNRRVVVAQYDLVEVTDPARSAPDPDTVEAIFAAGGSYEIYDPSFGALAAIISSGGLERVEDAEVRDRLAGWNAELTDLDWERDQVFDANDRVLESLEAMDLMAGIQGLTGWWRARLEATLTSSAHRQTEARFTLVTSLYTDDLVRIRRRADEVRTKIRAYLSGGG